MLYLLIFVTVAYLLLSRILEEDEEPGPDEVHLYYYKLDREFDGWNLWVWEQESDAGGYALEPARVESERVLFRISTRKYAHDSSIGLLFRKGNWEKKDGEDRFWKFSDSRKIYAVEGEKEFYLSPPKIKAHPRAAFLDNRRLIQVLLPCRIETKTINLKSIKVRDHQGQVLALEKAEVVHGGYQVNIHLQNQIGLGAKRLHDYKVLLKGFRSVFLKPRGILYETEFFHDEEMGMSLIGKELIFRTFAPTADKVETLLFKTVDGPADAVRKMTEVKPGLWELKLGYSDWEGGFYKYRVHGNDLATHPVRECLDPYSRCHTHRYGRSHIQFDHTEVKEGPTIPREEIVIYESHLRDLSISEDSGIKHKGKYLSLTEKNTHLKRFPSIKTGVAHLKELGINTLHLLPLQNFDLDDETTAYDWGYMPCHYFAPHGGYSSNPADLSRVQELKRGISSLHEEGIKVILDVVFNHTAEGTGNLISFQALAPDYYYRHTHEGDYFNGSGCGNELKTEAPMVRKLILDCLRFWVKEYKIDGFRFDLLGLMDYETFQKIEEEMIKIKPDIILYGEPWAAGSAGVEVLGKGVQKGTQFSVFNDHYRDALRGDNSKWSKGFVQGEGASGEVGYIIPVKEGILGSVNDFAAEPLESVNYVACHDNYTLRDKLILSTQAQDGMVESVIEKMETIVAILLLTSQGIPFIHSGQEFGRSKDFHHNSYNAPDEINRLDWTLKKKNQRQFQLYRDLISLRAQHRIFRLPTAQKVRESVEFLDEMAREYLPPHCIAFQLRNPGVLDSFQSALVAVNAGPEPARIPLPEGTWKNVLEHGKVHLKISSMKNHKGNQLELLPWDSRILARINKAD